MTGRAQLFHLFIDDERSGQQQNEKQGYKGDKSYQHVPLLLYNIETILLDNGQNGAYLYLPVAGIVEVGVFQCQPHIVVGTVDVTPFVKQTGEHAQSGGFFGGGTNISDGGTYHVNHSTFLIVELVVHPAQTGRNNSFCMWVYIFSFQ